MTSPTIFASCDPVYLRQFAPSFLASCAVHKNNAWIHIVDSTPDDVNHAIDLCTKASDLCEREVDFTVTYDQVPESSYFHDRVYYACSRFVAMDKILTDIVKVSMDFLITDIDAFLMDHINPIDEPIGLFLREPLEGTVGWEKQGTSVAAGVVYIKHPAESGFMKTVTDAIDRLPKHWFVDQIALYTAYEKYNRLHYDIHVFDDKFMDWEFHPGTKIWTGKGPRKYENPKYLEQKKLYEDMLK